MIEHLPPSRLHAFELLEQVRALLTGLTVGAVLVGLLIPLTPLGKLIGFVEPPPGFYVFLVCAVVAYLLLVEIVKRQLYRRLDARSGSVRASAHAHRRRVPRKAE